MTIQTLSQYQIRWLEGIFQYSFAPDNHQVKVQQIGIDENGEMIVEFKKYGRLITEKITRTPPSNTTTNG